MDTDTDLLLGPLLRRVDGSSASIWVETSRPCRVTVRAASADTFCVDRRHYAIVVVRDLPAQPVTYDVRLDGEVVWPPSEGPGADFPAPAIDAGAAGRGRTVIVAGSCLNAAPHDAHYDADPADHPAAVGPDALRRFAETAAAGDRPLPDALVLVGDQVYADADPTRPDVAPSRDFASHAALYRTAWSEPAVRWLLSSVPSAMIWDDHEVIDDWNISADWVADTHAEPDWDDRVTGALGAYWVHQHLGNLPVEDLESDALLAELRSVDDGWPVLRRHALDWDEGTTGTVGTRWSHHRRIGEVDVVVVDSRNGRVLDGERWMNDEAERAWLEARVREAGGRHVVIASSVPMLLPAGVHRLERWNSALCDGAWGRRAAARSERIRRDIDLEHWAAFPRSFDWLEDLLLEVAGSADPPRSITLLSGDVHFAYTAPATHDGRPIATQVVTSPLRNRITPKQERQLRLGTSRLIAWLGAALLRTVPGRRARLRWELADGPVFGNNLAVLDAGEDMQASVLVASVSGTGLDEAFRRSI